MIHSMCGGGLRDNQILSFAKIRFINNPLAQQRPYWYISNIAGLKSGDTVYAPFGKDQTLYEAEVVRVDAVSEQTPPIPLSKMGRLHSKLG